MPYLKQFVVALLGNNRGQMIEKQENMSQAVEEDSSARYGWRFGLGVLLIVGGYAAWSFIPVAVAADLHPGAKSALTGLLGATPFLTKVVAVALMGRPAYDFFKRSVWNFVRIRFARTDA